MRKLLLALISVVGLWFAGAGAVHAASTETDIKLYLDSRLLKPDVPPQIINSTTMVPVRLVSEELGAKVSWSDHDQKITVEKSGLMIVMHINKSEATVNGVTERLLKSPLLWEDTTTLVPVRFISEKLGMKVGWDELTQSVSLFSPAGTDGPSAKPQPISSASPTPAAPTTKPAEPAVTPKPSVKPSTLPATVTPSPAVSATPKPGAGTATHSASGPSVPTAPAGTVGGGLPEITAVTLDGDTLRIQSTGGELVPKFSTLSEPERLIIDLPHAAPSKTINGVPFKQNGELGVEHPVVSRIRYALYQDNPSTVRIVVDLQAKIEYTLLESKIPGELAVSLGIKKFVVVLDAGHGGKDPGASSVTGRKEKDFTLAMALRTAELLKDVPNIDLLLTREEDTYPDLNERVAMANEREADLFVSIHANSVAKAPGVNGVETYYTREASLGLAEVLHQAVLDASGSNDRGVRMKDLKVTRETAMPAVLLEIGYLSNVSDEEKLYNEEFQAKVAAAIAAGIQEYLQNP